MNSIEDTVSKYLGATCTVNDKVFKIIELEYYPAVEPEGFQIDTRESIENFVVNDIFVAGKETTNWKRCLVNIVIRPKESDKKEKIENLLIRGIKDDNGNFVFGPGGVYKYIFGERVVDHDNNGQIVIFEAPEGNRKIKYAQRKRNNKPVSEPFKYNCCIDD